MKKYNLGFTLIELLVVVFIIGLLATIVIVATTTARSNARDNRRKADLSSIAIALESYKSVNKVYVNKNYYPDKSDAVCAAYGRGVSYTCDYTKSQFLAELVTGGFIAGATVSNDPMYDSYVDSDGSANYNHAYTYRIGTLMDKAKWGSSDKGYELYGWLENTNDADVTKRLDDGSSDGRYMLVK